MAEGNSLESFGNLMEFLLLVTKAWVFPWKTWIGGDRALGKTGNG